MIQSTGMELVAGLDTQIFVIFLGVIVALGCTLIAFLVDYLKGKNERLREQVLEMTVRQEERARHPQLAVDSTAVLSAIAQVGKNLENVVRGALTPENQNAHLNHDGATPEAPVASIPVFQPRPSATLATLATLATEVPSSAPVFAPGPVMSQLAEEVAPVAAPELSGPAPIAATLTSEPDWRQASWAALPIPASDPEMPFAIESVDAPTTKKLPTVSPALSTEPVRETLRSLFDTPQSLAKAAQLEMQRHLDEPIPDLASVGNAQPVEELAEEPVVRIRVLDHHVSVAAEEPVAAPEPLPEAASEPSSELELPIAELVPEDFAIAEPLAPIPEPEAILSGEEVPEEVAEMLPVTAPVDFLMAVDLGEDVVPAPLESFDSLMAAVNAEPGIAPEIAAEADEVATVEVPSEPEDPGVLVLPSGMNDRATLDFLKRDKARFTGLIVSIGINDYARLQETSGRPAAEELAKSVTQLVKSLITTPNGSEFFGCRSADDEFMLVFAGESGSVAQRRLNGLSERLWDFQLRSLGNFSVMFSWGATEANAETFEDAVEAASERMRETRHNRRTISMEKTRLKKVG